MDDLPEERLVDHIAQHMHVDDQGVGIPSSSPDFAVDGLAMDDVGRRLISNMKCASARAEGQWERLRARSSSFPYQSADHPRSGRTLDLPRRSPDQGSDAGFNFS